MLSSSTTFKALLSSLLLAQAVAAGTYSSRFAPANATLDRRDSGFLSVGYFTNWNIATYPVSSIPVSTVSHVIYAFAGADNSTGSIVLSDEATDTGSAASGSALAGALGELFALKQQNRGLKTLLSVGGWTYSQNGDFSFVSDSTKRAKFVSDATAAIENYGLDGIDIDYEALTSDQTSDWASFLTELRAGLDSYAKSKGESSSPYLLTAAVGVSPNSLYDVSTMDKALDYWNMMDYDMSGSWSTETLPQSNLMSTSSDSSSIDTGISAWTSAGVAAKKLVMGIPLYGHSFVGTTGMYSTFTGMGSDDGTAYTNLPLAGAQVTEDATNGISYSYDSSKQELMTYDTPAVVDAKAKYVASKGLGGTMYWALNMDQTGSNSLISTAASGLGSLDSTQNHLSFPNSIFTNVASAAGTTTTAPPSGGGEGGDSTTSTEASTTSSSTSSSSTSSSTSCAAKRRRA